MKVVKVSLYNVSFYLFLKTKKYLLFLLRCISFCVFFAVLFLSICFVFSKSEY